MRASRICIDQRRRSWWNLLLRSSSLSKATICSADFERVDATACRNSSGRILHNLGHRLSFKPVVYNNWISWQSCRNANNTTRARMWHQVPVFAHGWNVTNVIFGLCFALSAVTHLYTGNFSAPQSFVVQCHQARIVGSPLFEVIAVSIFCNQM